MKEAPAANSTVSLVNGQHSAGAQQHFGTDKLFAHVRFLPQSLIVLYHASETKSMGAPDGRSMESERNLGMTVNTKRYLAAALCAVMLLEGLTGCGKKPPVKTETTAPSAAETTQPPSRRRHRRMAIPAT